jgi:MTH538 TIR-like domain (DUF1863)
MSTHQIHIFISHSWTYESHYNTLEGWIFGESWRSDQASLDFRNFSVPKNDPIHNAANDTQLRNSIYNQIARSHVIVIPTGVYASYSRWIKEEIDGAANYGKPILAVNPWAQERKSDIVQTAAKKLVGWNSESVINGIWELYRA